MYNLKNINNIKVNILKKSKQQNENRKYVPFSKLNLFCLKKWHLHKNIR